MTSFSKAALTARDNLMVSGERDQEPSIEEILAAVRRNLLNEAHGSEDESAPTTSDQAPPVSTDASEAHDDFELPQMFRTPVASPRQPARLSEKLEASASGDLRKTPANHTEPDVAPTVTPKPTPAELPRVMASCTDTKIARMSGPPVAKAQSAQSGSAFPRFPAPPTRRPRAAAPARAKSVSKGVLGAHYLLGEAAKPESSELGQASPSANAESAHSDIQDSALRSLSEEQAVALLRPLLRNWLDDNMQRMFTRALQSEFAEQGKRSTPDESEDESQ